MKVILLLILVITTSLSYAQPDDKITTIDFVQILDENREEVMFYYQNNWEVLRKMAVKMEYIHSYQILETPADEDAPFHLMLITTYKNEDQYLQREDHFTELIQERGDLKLLNDKKPGEFRKTLFNKERVRHWN